MSFVGSKIYSPFNFSVSPHCFNLIFCVKCKLFNLLSFLELIFDKNQFEITPCVHTYTDLELKLVYKIGCFSRIFKIKF